MELVTLSQRAIQLKQMSIRAGDGKSVGFTSRGSSGKLNVIRSSRAAFNDLTWRVSLSRRSCEASKASSAP